VKNHLSLVRKHGFRQSSPVDAKAGSKGGCTVLQQLPKNASQGTSTSAWLPGVLPKRQEGKPELSHPAKLASPPHHRRAVHAKEAGDTRSLNAVFFACKDVRGTGDKSEQIS
jgi:hypothetical protein